MSSSPRLSVSASARAQFAAGLARIRQSFELPEGFPSDVLREAQHATDRAAQMRSDRRDLALVTLDPAGSRDLDQAFAIDRTGRGYLVHYAIADVAAMVAPGGAVDREAWQRGVTIYLPDGRVPLHPDTLAEGYASLLPDQDTPAVLWTFEVDHTGQRRSTSVERAVVRSRAQLDYATTQRALDAGAGDDHIVALADVGALLAERERDRGGVSLDLADQEVQADGAGGYRLRYDRPTQIERCNAQLSLLTGMAAAEIMVDGGVGILRTLPDAPPEAFAAVREAAAGLGHAWPDGVPYAEWVRTIDAASPAGVALLNHALRTLRGAGYETFTSTPADPPRHAALAWTYAHATAPLRRLVDRYTSQIVVDVAAGRAVARWAVEGLAELPAAMSRAGQRAGAVDRAVLDLVESVLLDGAEGQEFDAVVVGHRNGSAVVQLDAPAVIATVGDDAQITPGTVVRVRLTAADATTGTVAFEVA